MFDPLRSDVAVSPIDFCKDKGGGGEGLELVSRFRETILENKISERLDRNYSGHSSQRGRWISDV